MSFLDKLTAAIRRNGSKLCVGLDPTLDALPAGVERSAAGVLRFNQTIIEATADLACAFKPNLAFYETLGAEGWRVLAETVRSVPHGIPVIADAKRSDIGSTAAAYAAAIFDGLRCDACTVNPYLGYDGVAPFIDRPGRFAFVLCRTSNPSAGDLQDLVINGEPLYRHVARRVRDWHRPQELGLVVGATDPVAASAVAEDATDLWLLAPGLGAQGGDLAASADALGAAASHTLWNASRAIANAGHGPDYAHQARAAAQTLRDRINDALNAINPHASQS